MNTKLQTSKYLISDILSAAFSWSLFYIYRKALIEPQEYGYQIPLSFNTKFYLSLVIIPVFWLFLYYIIGFYNDIYRRSRLNEFGKSLFVTFWGVIILFFAIILDDIIHSYKNYYLSVLVLFSLHFILSYIPRAIITSRTIKRIHKRKIGFNTLIIGGQDKAVEIFNEIESQKRSSGNKFIGFIPVNNGETYPIQSQLPKLGSINQVMEIIKSNDIKEVIIAIEYEEHEKIGKIISKLEGVDIIIKVIPSMYDILTGMVKMSSIIGTPLIEISHHLMPVWQQNFKIIIDKFVSIIALIILFPVSLVLAIGIKLTSKGPIIYSHDRLGKFGKPFKIYKFRSMYIDAEAHGPQLSSEDDYRVTSIGRFMRKSRLDEIPNFYNVLKGEMSLVGPRPERKYYVDQIIQIAPHYLHLQKVKPGITSWGQVKFGYATTIDEMVKRLKYDLIYIENMTLYVDLKILIYTLLTIVKGKGL